MTATAPHKITAVLPRSRRAVIWTAVVASAVLILGSSLVAASPAHATTVTFTDANGMSFSADDANVAAGATVTGYTGTPNPTIPATITIGANTYPVAAIGDFAFQSKSLTSVDIQAAITSIGDHAFQHNSLAHVVIPASVTSIGDSAFQDNQLETANLGLVSTIEPFAFQSNKLTAVDLGSATILGDNAFGHNLLTTVTLPNTITSISDDLFEDNLLTSVFIPNSVTSIGNGAFNMNKLANIDIPDSVTFISGIAFGNNLLTTVTIPASVTTIEYAAFNFNAATLTDVVFLGPPPAVFRPAAPGGSFGDVPGPLVHYPSSFAAPPAGSYAGGYTSPTWQGYNSQRNPIVSFDLGGHGTAIAPEDVGFGLPLAAPTPPTASGWTFTGWFTDAAHTHPVNFSNAITVDTTLYAGWTASPVLAATGSTTPILSLTILGAFALLAGIILRRRTRHAATQ